MFYSEKDIATLKRRTKEAIDATHELEALRWESIQVGFAKLPEKSLLEKMCGAVQEVAQVPHSELPDPDYMGAEWN